MRVTGAVLAGLVMVATASVAPQAGAEIVGRATSVTQGATLTEASGRRIVLTRRTEVSEGDVIETDATGQVQLVFSDRTRIVVGPDSELRLSELESASATSASRFAIEAVGGAFRFLSGRSPRDAYELRTPSATMGIRGTVFDFTVADARLTSLVTFRGQVEICATGQRCARVSGGCATVQATRREGIRQPQTRDDRNALLRGDFPFIVSQDGLGLQYRTRVGSCGDISSPTARLPAPARIDTRASEDDRDTGYDELADERG